MSFEDDFDHIILSPNVGGSGGAVVAITFHDEEYPERDGSDVEVARFFQKTSTAASVTGCHSASSSTGCVRYDQAAWHTGAGSPWNKMCEGYEHDGYAKQTRDEWLDPYGIRLLERSAKHTAKRLRARGIPCRWLTIDQLRHAIQTGNPAAGGMCTHHDITIAAGVKGGHYDPGVNFPKDYYLDRVTHYYNGGADVVPDPKVTPVVVTTTNSGTVPAWPGFSEHTKVVQGLLSELGINPGPIDGVFGAKTENAVIEFQNRALDTDGNRLVADGIVGPKTWASLQICVYILRVGDRPQPAPIMANTPPLPYNVQRGMTRDPIVKRVQMRLRERGWQIVADGDFGPYTEQIVRLFQEEKGLTVDGIVGPQTWHELYRTDNVT